MGDPIEAGVCGGESTVDGVLSVPGVIFVVSSRPWDVVFLAKVFIGLSDPDGFFSTQCLDGHVLDVFIRESKGEEFSCGLGFMGFVGSVMSLDKESMARRCHR